MAVTNGTVVQRLLSLCTPTGDFEGCSWCCGSCSFVLDLDVGAGPLAVATRQRCLARDLPVGAVARVAPIWKEASVVTAHPMHGSSRGWSARELSGRSAAFESARSSPQSFPGSEGP